MQHVPLPERFGKEIPPATTAERRPHLASGPPKAVQTALTVAICDRRSSPPEADNGNIFLTPAGAASKARPIGVFHSPATAAGGLPSAADTCFRPCGRAHVSARSRRWRAVRSARTPAGDDDGRPVRARRSRRQGGPRGRRAFGTFGFRTRRRRSSRRLDRLKSFDLPVFPRWR